MAFANLFASSKVPDDRFDTPSSTPPQVPTPQPDPTDRRFPSIFSSYFGQVRASLYPSTKPSRRTASMSSNSPEPAMEKDVSKMSLNEQHPQRSPPPPGQPEETPPLSPDENPDLPTEKECRVHAAQHNYPTPPLSSSTSSLTKLVNAGDPSANESEVRRRSSRGSGSPRRKPPGAEKRQSLSRKPTPPDVPPTTTSTTTTQVSQLAPAGLIVTHSNPTSPALSRASASFTPSAPSLPSEQSRLTESVSASGDQSTPPRTPRTQSFESKRSRTASPQTRTQNSSTSEESTKSRGHNSAVVGEQQGKLYVSIAQGRGLRPSLDPYVICQFQYNEYISKGPRSPSSNSDDDDGSRGIPMRRGDSDMGRPMAIPMKSRQSSQTSMSSRDVGKGREVTDPVWNHEAVFDVVGDQNELDISVYDNTVQETFLGNVRFCPSLTETEKPLDQWLKLEPREATEEHISGEIYLKVRFQKTEKRHLKPEDFQILKLIGKGTFGQVFQVRKRDTQRVYAMKVLSKKVIVQKKEVAHTLGERNILVRTAMADSPFIVGLKFSFQTVSDLYLVTDYMSGGELFWHLQKEGRFNEERARFYIAELILALQHLHQHDIVYRDLKPENILLDANGHIALCDFGLSKANLAKDDTTNTFCGTTEYLAPEVLLDEAGYTKMVDFWSLGVLVFEMCCGWSPFYAEDTQQMYKNIAFGKVRFPRDALSNDGRNFVKGLLNRNPKNRLGAHGDAEELKAHPFFADIDWDALAKKNIVPPFKPRLKSETDTSNFDPEFTNALNGASSLNARAAALVAGANPATTPLSPTVQANFKGFTFVDESSLDHHFTGQQDDAMDQDEDDTNRWNSPPPSPRVNRADRMSGVQATGGGEEGMFAGDDV